MDHTKCTLYSGGLKGAEAAFGEAAERMNIKEVIYTFEGHKLSRDRNTTILTQEELERERAELEEARRRQIEFHTGGQEMLEALTRGVGRWEPSHAPWRSPAR